MGGPIKFFHTCPRCEHEQEIGVILGEPAQTYGPPEMCDPGSPDEVDSGGVCEKCGFEFEEDQLFEMAAEKSRDDFEANQELRAEAQIERLRNQKYE